MKRHSTQLAAKVAAQNEANTLANERFEPIIKALAPFVGQKICKVDGSLLEKVKKALPVFPSDFNNSSFYSTGHGYSLRLDIRTCHAVEPNGCAYAESTVYLGSLDNGVLINYDKAPNLKTDFTEEYVQEARKEVEAAEKAMRNAEAKLYYFGRYDR